MGVWQPTWSARAEPAVLRPRYLLAPAGMCVINLSLEQPRVLGEWVIGPKAFCSCPVEGSGAAEGWSPESGR